MEPVVLVKRLDPDKDADLPLPCYMSADAAGCDLVAAETVSLDPGDRRIVSTGLSIAVPRGYEAQIRPRSGLALKYGITVINSPGTIDADYRGAVGILLVNMGDETYTVNRGDRIAQMVIAPVVQSGFELVEELPSTERGAGGFGHTGK